MPVCEWCEDDNPYNCPCCGRLSCWECMEITAMGCVHRKRIKLVTNPDWIIVEETGVLNREAYDYLRSRAHTGRIIGGFDR